MIQKCVLLLPLTFFYSLIKKKKKSNIVQITHFLASLSPCSYDINSSKSLMSSYDPEACLAFILYFQVSPSYN